MSEGENAGILLVTGQDTFIRRLQSALREADIQPIREFTAIYEVEGSLSCSQDLATGPYPEPNEPSSHPIFVRFILLYSHLCLDLLKWSIPLGFLTKSLCTVLPYLSRSCHMLRA